MVDGAICHMIENLISSKGNIMKKSIGLLLAIVFTSGVSAGDAVKGKGKSALCATCHGSDGNSALAINPKLAGQGESYLVKQMKDFKSAQRKNATMEPMVATLSEVDMADIAAFFSSQSIQFSAVPDEYIQLGQQLYNSGDADRDIPACMACHGANGNGMPSAGFPAVGGQHPSYVIAQLKAFRAGTRNNDNNNVMRDVVAKMSDKQIEAIAYYMVGLH